MSGVLYHSLMCPCVPISKTSVGSEPQAPDSRHRNPYPIGHDTSLILKRTITNNIDMEIDLIKVAILRIFMFK